MTASMSTRARSYGELATLLWNHGHWSFGQVLGLTQPSSEERANHESEEDSAAELARDLEQLGPVYIKFAQIASTRTDLVPKHYCQALRKLQDRVEPIPFSDIQEVVESQLDCKINSLFSTFDPQPLACASIAQVHRATLRDGQEVIVKVQRPGVVDRAESQLEALQELADTADGNTDFGRKMRFGSVVRAVAFAFANEIDYRIEARNLETLRRNLKGFDRLTFPRVIDDFTRERVLVMSFVSGTPIDSVSGVVLNELDTRELAEQLVNAYLQQTLINGVFHADPHPGNLLLTPDHKIAILDAGMVVHLSPVLRRQFGRLVLAIGESSGEEAAAVTAEIGEQQAGFDVKSYRKAVGQIVAQSKLGEGEGTSIGQALVELLTLSGEHGLVMPPEMIMFNKALLQIEETLARLDPELQLGQLVEQFCPRILKSEASEKLSLSRLTQTALEMADFSTELPKRLNRLTQHLADNEFRINVDSIDESTLVAGFEKVANRITAGLVSSALIIAASVLMHITSGGAASVASTLAIVFFVVAAMVGLYLIYISIIKDQWSESR